ncbi:Helix-hairpin-helix motif-containing protein [Chitinophaga sp. YR627]|uniref:helix-hairpin-helix domain-containing protein n=1 Tax=Chitinophaga sp. YR627 TaxID=1881041 RepID=UPI0008E2C1AC|nr:helix-hairpin-helix domain-containing protein [Chitinophaga sp. YR627]SFO14804.1 Helix-hairpin-helix motif-containing protein [Chitinophaga sp. YR627]
MTLKILACIMPLFIHIYTYSQTLPELTAAEESQLEDYTAHTDQVPEDDMHWQQLQAYIRHKINLNTNSVALLKSLHILSVMQIQQLLRYRQQLGDLLSIYELQAIPGFDMQLISRLLPYVQVGKDLEPHYSWRDYVKKGEHTLLCRYGRQLEKSRGYVSTDTTVAHYLGSPDKLLLRYRYNLTHYISWGAVMEKDAGEAFFKGTQRSGFDFYSVHLFIRQYKWIKSLALGDFTVNMGQGLLNWQSLAFGKGATVMQVKREGELLKPYASAGESNFFRGAGMTVGKGKWQATTFISHRLPDGSIAANSGYHRTETEAARKGSLAQLTVGANVTIEENNRKLGINFIQHHLSAPIQKGHAPYQLFGFEGKQLTGFSTDYEITWKNMHFFGEAAMSNNGKTALINGLLLTATSHVDLVLLYRNYDRAYHAFYADAWGEFYKPVNEKGIYTGISIKLSGHVKLNAYADHFTFPWLQYRTAGRGRGRDLLMAMTYTPDKQTELFVRYSYLIKQENGDATDFFLPPLVTVKKKSWRIQSRILAMENLTMKSRVELSRYVKEESTQQGFLLFYEMLYQCAQRPLQLYIRYTRFMTDGSNTSLYTITSGILYEYALSRLTGEGHQLQARIRWKTAAGLTFWLRYELTIYGQLSSIGNGWDEVKGNRKSLLQCQFQHLF